MGKNELYIWLVRDFWSLLVQLPRPRAATTQTLSGAKLLAHARNWHKQMCSKQLIWIESNCRFKLSLSTILTCKINVFFFFFHKNQN